MANESLKDRRDRGFFEENKRLIAIVLGLVVVVALAGAAAMLVLDGDDNGGDETSGGTHLDSVPQGVDGVIHIDGNVTDDDLVLDTADQSLAAGWWAVDTGVAPSIDEILNLIDDDEVGYQSTTAFFSADQSGEEYAGAVVEVDGEGMALVDIVESEVGELEQTTYSGVDVYQIDAEQAAQEADLAEEYDLTGLITQFIGNDTTAWVAPVGDGTVVLGSESAARDAIDVQQGEADPVGGDIRTAHERAESGPIELTADVQAIENAVGDEDITIANLATVIDEEIAAGLSLVSGQGYDVNLLSGTYTPRDRDAGTATIHVQAMMGEQEGAVSLMNLLESRVDEPNQVADSPEEIRTTAVSERAAGNQEGEFVDLEIPEMPETVVGHVTGIIDKFGAQFVDRTALDLVPASVAAESVQTIDDPEDLDHDMQALDDREIERIATYSNDTQVGTVVELGEDAEDFVSFLEDQAGQDFTLRAGTDGYRRVDIYELNGTTEPEITEVLSGDVEANTEWIAPVTSDMVVFGTEGAVTGSIDVYRGVGAANGDLSW